MVRNCTSIRFKLPLAWRHMKVQSEVIQNFRFNYDGQSLSALTTQSRRSRQEVFCENGAFKNFEKFTGKHQSLV